MIWLLVLSYTSGTAPSTLRLHRRRPRRPRRDRRSSGWARRRRVRRVVPSLDTSRHTFRATGRRLRRVGVSRSRSRSTGDEPAWPVAPSPRSGCSGCRAGRNQSTAGGVISWPRRVAVGTGRTPREMAGRGGTAGRRCRTSGCRWHGSDLLPSQPSQPSRRSVCPGQTMGRHPSRYPSRYPSQG
jgi:hypothetical protein